MQNKGLFLPLLGLPELCDICAELVHKFAGDGSISEDLFSRGGKSK